MEDLFTLVPVSEVYVHEQGSSGGPVVSLATEMAIGMLVAKAESAPLSFALPFSSALETWPLLKWLSNHRVTQLNQAVQLYLDVEMPIERAGDPFEFMEKAGSLLHSLLDYDQVTVACWSADRLLLHSNQQRGGDHVKTRKTVEHSRPSFDKALSVVDDTFGASGGHRIAGSRICSSRRQVVVEVARDTTTLGAIVAWPTPGRHTCQGDTEIASEVATRLAAVLAPKLKVGRRNRDELILVRSDSGRIARISRVLVTNRLFREFLNSEQGRRWRPTKENITGMVDQGIAAGSYLTHWENGEPKPGTDNQPVRCISRTIAEHFLRYYGGVIGERLRLPREHELLDLIAIIRQRDRAWRSHVCYAGSGRGITDVGHFGEHVGVGLCDILGLVGDLCLPNDQSGGCAVGGSFHSSEEQLSGLVRFDAHDCRLDVGFRFVAQ